MSYFDKYKTDMFPIITDWTSNQDELRFAKDINKHPSKYYYFFHHLSYKITMWSFHILSFLIFLTITILLIVNQNIILSIIFLALCIYKMHKIKLFLHDNKHFPYRNFYDLFLREY